jgi:uncharacterized membrane-anchored protein YjiN (DUF445 family)
MVGPWCGEQAGRARGPPRPSPVAGRDAALRQPVAWEVLAAIDGLVDDLKTSPAYRERLHAAKQELLDRPEVETWLRSIWDELRDALLSDLESSPSYTRQTIANALVALGRALEADAGMRTRLNRTLEELITALLSWRGELSHFIADVVQRWDEKALVERMELALGADLQYVRFTGTLVGAAIGFLLALLPLLIDQVL